MSIIHRLIYEVDCPFLETYFARAIIIFLKQWGMENCSSRGLGARCLSVIPSLMFLAVRSWD